MLRQLALAAGLGLATLLPISASGIPSASATSGVNCFDAINSVIGPYHLCAQVFGTGLSVYKVHYDIRAGGFSTWCGQALVQGWSSTQYWYQWSPAGCANSLNDFTGTMTLNWPYHNNGILKITPVGLPGYPNYGAGGFSIFGPPPVCSPNYCPLEGVS